MGKHDDYGKELLTHLLGARWDSYTPKRSLFEGGVRADLDGVIWSRDGAEVECAVEIEARVYKQIRGAIVDLALHNAPKKLLVVLPAQPQLGTREQIERHCQYIWEEIADARRGRFLVICLKGTGDNPAYQRDRETLADALGAMGVL